MSELEQQVTNLGRTSDMIAANLAAIGITGERKSIICCPVANYLKSLGHLRVEVDVEDDDDHQLTYAYVDGEFVDLPDPVVDFISRFDAGAYPHLDAAMSGGGSDA